MNPVDAPRSTGEVRRQLADLESTIALATGRADGSFAAKLHLLSMDRQKVRLLDELRAAELLESVADAEVLFRDGPVRGHEIEADFFGTFVTVLQKLSNAVAQALAGTPTTRAPVPRNIAAEAKVLLGVPVLGSYGLRFRFPSKQELGQVLDTSAADVLDVLRAVFEDVIPRDEARGVVALPRVRSHYTRLFRLLAEAGASATLRTRRQPFGITLHPGQARERLEWIELAQVTEARFEFKGVLTGGDLISRRFAVADDTDRFSGRATDQAVKQLRGISLGESVVAEIREINVEREEDAAEASQSYVLERIRPLIEL